MKIDTKNSYPLLAAYYSRIRGAQKSRNVFANKSVLIDLQIPRSGIGNTLNKLSSFHQRRGKLLENLGKPLVAIRAYESAKYYQPENVSLYKELTNIRIQLIKGIKV